MFPSSAENSGKCYSQPLFGSFASSESFETNGSDRYGAYESFGLGALNNEGADSVVDSSNGGYTDTCSSWGADVLSDCIRPFVMSSQRSRSPFSDSGRESPYSTSNLSDSSSLYSPSHSWSAPIGSQGRDMQAYVHRNYRGIGAVVPEAKGQDVGLHCSSKNSSICIERYYSRSAALAFRGTKRKMMQPVPPCKMVKKTRIVRATPSISTIVGIVELGKRVRAREKRRRRRRKNHEKYGDKHRWAFTCAFCKFHTFEDKDIEKHFGSTYHRETLDYIRRQAKFDDKVISFLHDCMVHKFHKTVSTLHKLKFSCGRSKDEWAKIMEGMTLSHFAYKEQLKRDSVVTAKAIINNDNVKVRYEKYMKGEDPFANDANDTSSDSQDPERSDEAEEDEENSDS
uniref:DBIRD complex subunit ZNF326 n=1 Tax=Sinocyclocheilus anshuiensis TaxID=1608454 RepID=A0A671KAC1_9TELE